MKTTNRKQSASGGFVKASLVAALVLTFLNQVVAQSDPALFWSKVSGPWTSEFDGSFGAIAVHPTSPNIIFIGSSVLGGPGVLKSSDGGATWTAKNTGIQKLGLFSQNYPGITKIVFSPSNPSIIYLSAAVENGFAGGAGYVYRSADGGETWQKINGQQNIFGIYQIQNAVLDLDVNPQNPNIVYIGVAAQGILKTVNGGTDWNTIYAASPAPNEIDYFNVVRVSPTDPNTVFFSGFHDIVIGAIPTIFGEIPNTEGLLPFLLKKSTDGGSNWTPIGNLPQAALFTDLQFEKASGNWYVSTIAYKTPLWFPEQNFGIFKSPDSGQNWQAINSTTFGSLDQIPFVALMANPSSVNKGVFASTGFGDLVIATTDTGSHWLRLDPSLLNAYIGRSALAGNKFFILTSLGIWFTDISSMYAPAAPTISSVSPATLPPSGSPQLITINGANFLPSGDPNASALVFYDPANTTYNRTPINVTATSMQYNITVQSATGTWKVKVVNGGVESLPYSFTVSSSPAAQLTGLSISGPATVNENASGQFTAKAIFSDGFNPTVTPTWSVSSGPASISASGQLNAGSVSANTAATVSASYTSGGVAKTASANVTVVDTDAICGYQFQQIIVNPNFAGGGSGWTLTGAFQADSRFATCRSCPGYAYLANADGSAGNNLSGVLSQTFTIPGNAVEAALDFWDRTTTTETKGSFIDRLNVRLRLSNNSLVGLADIWNSNANTAYTQHSIDLVAYKGQTVTLEFAGTTDASGPTTFRIDDVTLNVTTTIPPTPVSLVISGPSSVTEGGTGHYYATMIYCDATTANVSALTWGNNTPLVVSFTSGGLLTAGLVSQDTVVSIYTTATVNGQNYQAFKDVTVVNQPVTFSSLAISGPSSMNENSSGQFAATAIFSDGTSQAVTPSWSENSSATSISGSGLLTTGEVGSDTTVTVSASYTIGGVTRNASQQVTVINVPPPPTLTSLNISGPSSVNENSSAQFFAAASFSDGSSQVVDTTWSEDSAATSISIFGLLSAGEVASDTSVTISASYTTGGVTRNAQKGVTVLNTTGTPTYTLTVNAVNGTVAKNPNQANYVSGSQVVLTASAASGYQFNNWSGDTNGSQNPLTVTMTVNKNITANFASVPPQTGKQLTEMGVSNSVIRFVLNGPTGSNYVIQVSSNLVSWVNRYVKTIPGGGSTIVTEALAGHGRRFYRAVTNDTGSFVVQPGPLDSQDIWTTSFYSYAPGGSTPGGGQNDNRLRVGGWGDLYYSLLQFNLADLPTNVTSAVLYLYCYNQSGGGTTMYFDRVTSSWDWRTSGTGRDHERLWWADQPSSSLWGTNPIPNPTQGQWYSVDITALYNAWQNGTYPNYGVQFRPVNSGNNNFNEFYSADYTDDLSLRPKLVITK